jgi:DNA-binding MarR family transcriptional regulator
MRSRRQPASQAIERSAFNRRRPSRAEDSTPRRAMRTLIARRVSSPRQRLGPVDRVLAPLGLTHAQYTLLASLYGFSRTGAQPSQRELANWTGLEPIFVSKLARALEQAGLIERTEHPVDPRAFQLHLTDDGSDVAQRAIAIIHAFQEEFTAPIGGTESQRNRDLVRTLQTLLGTENRSDPMAPPATLTGQDVGEAEGALTALLNQVLAGTNTGITRPQYIALRVLALRDPAPSPAALHDDLASQPQLGLDDPRSPSSSTASKPEASSPAAPPTAPAPPNSPPKAPPSTPNWPTLSPPSPSASTPTWTPTTSPPPTGSWSRSPNAPTASATNPEAPRPTAAVLRQPATCRLADHTCTAAQ